MARPRTDIEPRIVHAARARFLAEGVDGASLRTIAADARTSVGMISYYFRTKDDLFLAVVEALYTKLLDDLGVVMSDELPIRERMKRAFIRLGRASDAELAVMRLVAREALISSTRFERIVARAQRGHIAMVAGMLAEGVRRGEIDPDVPPPLALICTFAMGGLSQFVRLAVGRRSPFSALPEAEGLAELSTELIFRAIGAHSPASTTRSKARSRNGDLTARSARSNNKRSNNKKRPVTR